MIKQSTVDLMKDFVAAARLAGSRITLTEIDIVESTAPHIRPSSLPSNKMAVYVFTHGERCLKVGKSGPKSVARYCSHHYGLNAPSTLAKSLLKHQHRIGVNGLDEANIGAWIIENTHRMNFLISTEYSVELLSLLEAFVQCRLNPEFEGFYSQRVRLK